MRRTALPDEVASWLDQAWFDALQTALAEPPWPADDAHPLSPLFHMATRVRKDGKLTAELEAIEKGLKALGDVAGIPLPPRVVIRDKPPAPKSERRRRRALPLPSTIVLRRFGRSICFWADVIDCRSK